MMRWESFDEALTHVADWKLEKPLIAIDGLPCSGKSTLAARLEKALDFECIYLDDFVLLANKWPSRIKPAFPFEYVRYDAFLQAVVTLASTGSCTYFPFDWETLTISSSPRTVLLKKPVIVEGISSLNPAICHLCGLKIFVESDRSTTLAVALARGAGLWANEWQNLFLPSADLYMETHPELRANVIVTGRIG